MDESNNTITSVIDLIAEMQQAVNNGEIQLSRQEWAQIYDFLAEYEGLLESDDVSELDLENVAWEVVEAFEENELFSFKK